MTIGNFGGTVGIRLGFDKETGTSHHTDNLINHLFSLTNTADINMNFHIIFSYAIIFQKRQNFIRTSKGQGSLLINTGP